MTRKQKGSPFRVGWRAGTKTEWIGGRFQLPVQIEGWDATKPQVQLWVELPDNVVVGYKLDEFGKSRDLGETILEAFEHPVAGEPRRPDSIRVATEEEAEEVRAVLGSTIPISVAPTPELDTFLEGMVEQLSPLSAQEDAGTPPYLADRKVSATEVEALFSAAAELAAAAPWEYFSMTHLVRLDIPDLGVEGACVTVVGDPDESCGFHIFPSELAFMAFLERVEEVEARPDSPRPHDLGTDWISLMLEPFDQVPRSFLEEAEEMEWTWSRSDNFPVLRHASRDGELGPVSPQDVAVATDCAFALSSLIVCGDSELESLAEEDGEPFSVSFRGRTGREVQLTVPFEAFEQFEETSQPALPPKKQSFKPRVGRNAPCPCGSGKKYKKCHLSIDRADAERETVHERDGRLVAELDSYATEVLDSSWWERTIDFDDASEDLSLSRPWAVYEALVVGQPVVDWFLEKGCCNDPEDIAWLEAQQRSWLSIWEVTGVVPGESLDLVDSLTLETRHVFEESGSEALVIGDHVLARVADFGGESVLVGMYPRALPPKLGANIVQKMRKKLRRKSAIPIERMQQYQNARYLLRVWEEVVDEMDAFYAMMKTAHDGARDLDGENLGDGDLDGDDGFGESELYGAKKRPISAADKKRIALSFKREHYSGWIDISLPALGDKTPREAAKSADGRRQLEALIDEMADHERKLDPDEAFDFDEIRKKLGLAGSS